MNRANLKGWHTWKMDADSNQLFFRATKGDDAVGRVFVDTGTSYGLRLSPALWKEWRNRNPDARTTLEMFRYAVGDPTVYEIAWVDEYRLGDLVLRHVDIGPIPGAGEEEAIDAAGKEYVAALGINGLRNLRMIINAGDQEVLTQSLSPVLHHNRLGAVFDLESSDAGDDAVFVARVLPGSPAEKAGLESGDVLIEINGVDFRHGARIGKHPYPFFLLPAGTELKIHIRRSEATHELTAVLEELLP